MAVVARLSAEELRVLGCLIEKSYTTPDQYPLTTKAITTACNQKSSREPVVEYSAKLVDEMLQTLRQAGWVRMVRQSGGRAFKHRHMADEVLGLATPELAVLTVLALRGRQSPGELKTRTDRYHRFDDLTDVERSLVSLRDRPQPLVHNVGRVSGQSQDRWVQLLGPVDPDVDLSIVRPTSVDNTAKPASSTDPGREAVSKPESTVAGAAPPSVSAKPASLIRSESAPPIRPSRQAE